MNNNKDFYKKFGFVFIGIIIVLVIAKFTLLDSSYKSYRVSDSSSQTYNSEDKSMLTKESKKVISWQEADKYYGKYMTVEGVIVKTYNSGKACFLNFHPDYKRYFTAIIFKSDFGKFPKNPEELYKDKKVQVTGKIKEYNGKSEIILHSPSQIKILK